ncbi:PACE efflux transporter [Rodentibacter pneumotropicus]|uniref:PACE efflux transporter n=1 Tax=Rodentibacter pneumotropicus TaxID=758 RepID=A0A4S2PDG6_9PAST|nr:PACE efflux transporter [Rodentibacter pneumotropicus]THA01149.1 PACE efflux transporter [Rodentibacter pneumotropicus]THA02265.1 PACE efflux transporter [Rodentibacter pneumotropicus]THA06553.1 PACE efflux transporter [Rodentibacter pneumotropicus]THA15322.1 PACE efflux transporter [Rodentibacter pneumotropicus]
MMTLKERILHSVLFEIGAVGVSTIAVLWNSPEKGSDALGVGILMSLVAMVWNLIFNSIFDKIFTAPRETRGLGIRILHTVMFECGLLIATVPMIAYFLQLTLWQALVVDIGLSILIMIYALIFNWIYDNIRLKFV